MKELKENLKTLMTYQTADTVNCEDFPAWRTTVRQALEQFALTGTMGHSFYASARKQTKEAVALLESADAADLSEAIIMGRQNGFIRSFPILGLVYLSKKSPALFKQAFPQVVLTGNDLADFIDMVHQVRGLGRGIKSAIHAWLDENLSPYYAMKYRTALADAIRVSRYKGEDPLCAFVLSAYKGIGGVNDERLATAEAKYPELAARRKFIQLIESGKTEEAAETLRSNPIDTDSLAVWYNKFDTQVWTEVAKITPVMKFLKYLSKFRREGVDVDEIAQKKISVASLKKAKVFPFRLYTAYLAAINAHSFPGRENLVKIAAAWPDAQNTEGSTVTPKTAETLEKVLDQYAECFDWEEFDQYSWVIAPDISGSMSSRIGQSSLLTFAHISGMFTAFFSKGLKDVTVLPWDTEVQQWEVSKKTPVIQQIDAMVNRVGGGTYMEAPVKYLLEHKIQKDFCVFLTDTEEYGSGWLAAWKEYHALYPHSQAFLLRADSYQSSPVSEEDAEKYGIWQIFGWNDSVLDYMKVILQRNKREKPGK